MILEFLLKGIVVGFVASVPLGPVGVLCIQRTINKGKISGIYSGLGAATVDAAFALIAVLGLSFIIQFWVIRRHARSNGKLISLRRLLLACLFVKMITAILWVFTPFKITRLSM